MILSKTYNKDDAFPAEIMELVDRHWDDSQHWSRKWEYAMGLTAYETWMKQRGAGRARRAYDVGGAGSPFEDMVDMDTDDGLVVIDPAVPGMPFTLEQYLGEETELAGAVFCISVIEHVDDLDEFLYHLSCLVAPGGLLFLTTDYQPDDGPDNKHWHWMRKRIFGPVARIDLSETLLDYQFSWLGERDYAWHGPIENWGYCPASLALVKRA